MINHCGGQGSPWRGAGVKVEMNSPGGTISGMGDSRESIARRNHVCNLKPLILILR